PEKLTFRYASAGHPPPLYVAPSGDAESLAVETDPAMGILNEVEYSASTLQFEPGGLLLLYTDGIIEALNPAGEEFGEERLARLLEFHRGDDVEEIRRAIKSAVDKHREHYPLRDDTTFIIIRAT
ncbi:MAG: PP2C family protein-serine/threonine phosphatase, partial [Candidatus Brocadiia bacterium]